MIYANAATLQSSNLTLKEKLPYNDNEFTPESDITIPNKSILIVSTAALPWMTGTAVNPLLRAGHLCRYTKRLSKENNLPECQLVTLALPWLELEEDRETLYGDADLFRNELEQENYIRAWMKEKAGLKDESSREKGLNIIWYPARYHYGLVSIFAMGDLCSQMPPSDVCILEEPEHLNWYRSPGDGWTTSMKFKHVVGIVHTNYSEYASTEFHGLWTSPGINFVSACVIRGHCHKVIKLSAALPNYAQYKEQIMNVHGVRDEFLLKHPKFSRGNQTYFIGKILWAKGFDKMLQLQDYYKECTGNYFDVHIYGNGPDYNEIVRAFHGRKHSSKMEVDDDNSNNSDDTMNSKSKFNIPKSRYEFRRRPISNAKFLGRVDHIELAQDYKTFVNPSISEVLCTTTAEALAMGKFVIIPVHPCNEFFMKFPNCLAYHNESEFVDNLRRALSDVPEPLSESDRQELTWEAATNRFIKTAVITKAEACFRAKMDTNKLDDRARWFHDLMSKGYHGDTVRWVLGGGPVSEQTQYILEKQQKLDLSQSASDEEEDGHYQNCACISLPIRRLVASN